MKTKTFTVKIITRLPKPLDLQLLLKKVLYDAGEIQSVEVLGDNHQEYRRHVFTLETLAHMEVLRNDGHMIAHQAVVAAMVFFQNEEGKKFKK